MPKVKYLTEKLANRLNRIYKIETFEGEPLACAFDKICDAAGMAAAKAMCRRDKQCTLNKYFSGPADPAPHHFANHVAKQYNLAAVRKGRRLRNVERVKEDLLIDRMPLSNTVSTPEGKAVICGLPGGKFYKTPEWRALRYKFIKRHGAKCMACGATPQEGAQIEVDHIRPRSLFPERALDINNLQILCKVCHDGKALQFDDWRQSA
jgi:5-methylcytosine-specific restriction endonuclease McrA